MIQCTELNNGDMKQHYDDIADTMHLNPHWWMDTPAEDMDDILEQMDVRFEKSFA